MIDLLPLRFRDVVRVVRRGGAVEPDVAFVQVGTPHRGRVSLGISCSIYLELIASAKLVIAEMHPDMPRTCGATEIALEELDLVVDSGAPLGTYRSPRQTERDANIVERVLELIPRGAWVQLGVGAIPDAVLPRLCEIDGVNLHSGMLSDGLRDFLARARHRPKVVTGEIAGSLDLYRAVAGDERVLFRPTSVTHDLTEIARLPRFVSINSAVEIDLQGQVNGETIDGVQMSGVGGSLDFVEGAAYSEGGISILALASTTEDGARSKIDASLSDRTPVSLPRYCTDAVVTEFGVARLRGMTLRQRGEALVAIAHPDFRAALSRELERR
jgi:4-hydroxybutyrate CoA-transferase